MNIIFSALAASKIKMLSAIFLALILHPACANAIDGLWLSAGRGMNDALIQNKNISGARQQAAGIFWRSDYRFENSLLEDGELEFEAYAAQIKDRQSMKLIALRPVVSFWQNTAGGSEWYWQFGVGLSYFNSTRLSPIRFSSKAQFATLFGVGMPLGTNRSQRLTLRYNHYSNGYLRQPNPGLDTFSLDWHLAL